MSTLFFAPACTFLLQLLGSSGPDTWAVGLLSLLVAVPAVVALSEILAKAGQPRWAALVPVYDIVVLLKAVGRPWWWLLFMLVPLANVAIFLVVCLDLARVFGRGRLFGLGLLALAPACQLVLAYGGARYAGVPVKRPQPAGV